MKSGFVAIIGRPNAGKSTLLNALLKEKVSITSYKAQTTRNAIIGIYNAEDIQIVFADTPGIHKANSNLGTYMNKEAIAQAEGVDVIYYIVDAQNGLTNEDMEILKNLATYRHKIFLLLNKVDEFKDKRVLLEKINELKEKYDFSEIIPISAKKKSNLDSLLSSLKKYLPEMDKIYSEEDLTNVSTKFIMAEFVREKVLELTRQEIPHTVTCYVENYEEEENLVHIQVLIVVDRDNIKKIIIGKHGSMLKEIGSRARHDMEEFLGKKVYLETYVKTLKNWRDEEKYFLELGLKEED